ncbi:Der1-like family protein [Diplocarpon rosae]|nr:Der1-like family protein [Diplocarpon rosae]
MSAMDMFWSAPPITRSLTLAVFVMSVAVYTGILNGVYVIFYLPYLWKFPPQIWRLATPFLLTGEKLSILFDTYFLYTYGSKLETASPRFTGPGDFFTYILFVCLTIVGLNVLVTGGMIFTSALILAFAYTSTQEERGQKASFFIITIPAQFIPYAMLLMTLIMAGPDQAKVQATGLVAAHLHDFLTRLYPTFRGGRNLVPTPAFVKRMWQTTASTVDSRSYGTAFTPAQRATVKASGSSVGGVLPESWRTRGSGHRLGGD